jgi:hypothetical protein
MSALNGCDGDKAAAANTLFISLSNGAAGDQEVCVDNVSIQSAGL